MIITNIIEKKLISKIKKSPNISIGDVLVLNNLEQIELNKYNLLLKDDYPLDYIIEYLDINDIRLFLEEGVFIPRPCTEELIQLINTSDDTIVDICSGSGLIGLSLAKKYPNKSIILIEYSNIACKNILKSINFNGLTNVKLIHQDALTIDYTQFGQYTVVCNPPYVPELNIYESVKFEPKDAIYSGIDGLTFFNKLITMLSTNLPNQIYLELDPSNINQANNTLIKYFSTTIIEDSENFPRFLIGNGPSSKKLV
jgi:release factor glutamine methyltransferase